MILGGRATNGDLTANAHPDKGVWHVSDSSNATAALRNVGNHLDVNRQARSGGAYIEP